jgi:hypothetical protein
MSLKLCHSLVGKCFAILLFIVIIVRVAIPFHIVTCDTFCCGAKTSCLACDYGPFEDNIQPLQFSLVGVPVDGKSQVFVVDLNWLPLGL